MEGRKRPGVFRSVICSTIRCETGSRLLLLLFLMPDAWKFGRTIRAFAVIKPVAANGKTVPLYHCFPAGWAKGVLATRTRHIPLIDEL